MNILFFGSGAFALPSLDALRASGHRLLHVISQPDRPAGRGAKLTPTPVTQYALDHNLPVTRTENANTPDFLAFLRSLAADAFVVIAFGQKLSDELLAIPRQRLNINLHSSLLPKYRGAAPINWAVLNNDPVAGVSVIEVTSVMDAGDILAVASTPVAPAETAGELHDRLALLGSPLLPAVLDAAATGSLSRTPQDHSQKSRASKLSREMAWVDFSRPASEVSARIRGLSPWPGVQLHLLDPSGTARVTATILKCRASSPHSTHSAPTAGQVLPDRTLACATGSLEVLTLQPAGKKPMDFAAFCNGYRVAPGQQFRSVLPPAAPETK